MIKPDSWIKEWASAGGIEPFKDDLVNPASLDVRLGNTWIFPNGRDGQPQHLKSDSVFLHPGEVVLATTKEYVKIPRTVAADLKLKSSIGRQWINHCLAGWIDPGFSGEITLELQNIGPNPVELRADMRIAQLIFFQMESAPDKDYSQTGRYQGQRGATPHRKDI